MSPLDSRPENYIQKQVELSRYCWSPPSLNDNISSPPLLILCNKQDADLAKGSPAVQNLLEKEIEKVRKTRSNQLAGIEGEDSGVVYIGKEGKTFEFKDLPADVQFEESSALDQKTLAGSLAPSQ